MPADGLRRNTPHKSSCFALDAGPLSLSYVPKVQHIGKITWGLTARGHDWKFVKQPVRIGFDDFTVWSAKGFNVPQE